MNDDKRSPSFYWKTGKDEDLLEYLFSNTVENHLGCWLWTKSCFKVGYGQKKLKGVNWKVHRLVYTLLHGPIPEGKIIRHLCGNRRCCNPLHLDEGTLEDNAKDSIVHGTSRFHNINQNGVNNHMASLDEQTIYELRNKYATGEFTFEGLAQSIGSSRKAVERAIRGHTYPDFNQVPPIPALRKRAK